MSEVTIEPFNVNSSRLIRRAKAITSLVHRNRPWLLDDRHYGGVVERYDRDHPLRDVYAIHNVRRIGRHDKVRPGVIMESGAPIGLGTVILNQSVEGNEIGSSERGGIHFMGTNADYWLDDQFAGDTRLHYRVATRMTEMAAELTPPEHDIFALLPTNEKPHQPDGFAQIYEAIGPPSSFDTTDREDPYDVTRGGETMQAYIVADPFHTDLLTQS